jgi:ABC-type lipoprotein export system ATPase subunit
VEQVSYTYSTKYQKIEAVKQISCSFKAENLYAITGESGSGKSTFLSLLAGLALPTTGTIYVDGKDMRTLDRDEYRKDQASVVYQSFHLFPLLTALENVMFPIELKGVKKAKASEQAKILLKKVGLPDKIWRQFPQMMSGGEQQRVAIARAMAAGGKILLADEPTGNLDSKNEKNIVELLKNLAHTEKYVVIVITHNPMVAAEADVVLSLKDGELQRDEEND